MPYSIGTTSSMTDLMSLATPVAYPKSTFKPYTEVVALASGGNRGVGAPVVEWRWGYLTQAQRTMLRTYCAGASATVYISTRANDTSDAFVTYTGKVNWPLEESRDAFRRIDFVLTFTNLVLVP